MFTNRQIVSAVLAKWLEPLASGLLVGTLVKSMPAITAIDNKIRSTGWVSQGWSIASELEPLIGRASSSIIAPIIEGMLASIPDDSLVGMTYGIIDHACEMGELSLLEGKITLDSTDLNNLKHLMEKNLARDKVCHYEVAE